MFKVLASDCAAKLISGSITSPPTVPTRTRSAALSRFKSSNSRGSRSPSSTQQPTTRQSKMEGLLFNVNNGYVVSSGVRALNIRPSC